MANLSLLVSNLFSKDKHKKNELGGKGGGKRWAYIKYVNEATHVCNLDTS